MKLFKNPLYPHNYEKKHEIIENESFKRINNRKNNEIRDMFIKLGKDGKSDSSCFYSLGNTKILTLIYGPNPETRNISCNKLLLDLEIKSLCMGPFDDFEKKDEEIKDLLTESITNIIFTEQYHNTHLKIKTIIIKNDGGCLSAVLTCISMALINAGVLMKDMISSIHINSILCPKDKKVYYIVDLDEHEEKYYKSKYEVNELTLGICMNLKTVCFFNGSGCFFNNKILAEMVSFAEGACRSLGNELKKALKK